MFKMFKMMQISLSAQVTRSDSGIIDIKSDLVLKFNFEFYP